MSTKFYVKNLTTGKTTGPGHTHKSKAFVLADRLSRSGGRYAVILQEVVARSRKTNPHRRRSSNPRGKVPPHLKKYLFKKARR